MNQESSNKKDATKTELAKERTDVALMRTRMAAERTLMAWIRTSLSMIGFGFTILKFFQYLEQTGTGKGLFRPGGPRHVGLALIAFGTFLLVPAVVTHWHSLTELKEIDGRPRMSLGLLVAGMMASFGVLLFASVFFRWAFF